MRSGSSPFSKKGPQGKRERFSRGIYAQGGGAPGDQRGLMAALQRFLEHRGVQGYAEGRHNNYERFVREFIGWAGERGVTHPQQVSLAVLERYQRSLYHYRKRDGEPLSVRSRRAKLAPLRGFFKWLTRSGEIPANPAAELELPRDIRSLPRAVLTQEEAERVLALPDTGTPLGLRDRAMLEVLYATGMRRAELTRLQTTDIEPQRALVFICQGKGYKDRLIPLGERALHWVEQYLQRGRGQLMWNADDATLFLGNEGLPLHPSWLAHVVRGYVKRAEISKRGSCHLWRHTMATLMLEGGADIRFVQAMLGHENLATTQVYTHVAVGQLARVHANTHPGAQRRVRAEQPEGGPVNVPGGAAAGADGGKAQEPAQNAVAGLLDALAAEAEEEDADDAGAVER